MTGNSAALDTNVAVAINNQRSNAIVLIRSLSQVFLPVPVLGELLFGAVNSNQEQKNRERVQRLLSRCQLLSIDADTAETYATIRLALKRSGRPIPENDLWIAALCVQHALPLATADAHFNSVSGLTTISP